MLKKWFFAVIARSDSDEAIPNLLIHIKRDCFATPCTIPVQGYARDDSDLGFSTVPRGCNITSVRMNPLSPPGRGQGCGEHSYYNQSI